MAPPYALVIQLHPVASDLLHLRIVVGAQEKRHVFLLGTGSAAGRMWAVQHKFLSGQADDMCVISRLVVQSEMRVTH